MEKGIQININNKIDNDDKTEISSFFVAEEHNILTLELINMGYITECDTQIFYYDKLFEQLLEEGNLEADKKELLEKEMIELRKKFVVEFRKSNKKKIKEFLKLLDK